MYSKWIKKGLSKGFSDLEIFINKNKENRIFFEDNKIENYSESELITAYIKVIYQNRIATAYIENLDDDNFDRILELLKQSCLIIDNKEPAIIFEGSEKYPDIKENTFDFSKIKLDVKIDLLKKLENNVRKSTFCQKTDKIIYEELLTQKMLINSKGINLKSENNYAYIYGSFVFQKDKDVQSYSDFQLVKNFNEFNIEEQVKKIIEFGEKKLGGVSVKSKMYSVVFSNDTFADILESFSSIFSAEKAHRNTTKLKNRINQVVASSKVNIIDDPLTDLSYFKEKFDDEGVACYKKDIIKNGIFKLFVNNLKTAKILKQTPTGNGFRSGISMTNCYLEKGHKSFSDMISVINDGIYITDLVGLHVGINTISGDFSLQASGFKIDEGKITYPVKMIVVSGNFFDILKNLKEIANDFKFQSSGFGSASVYVGDLSIGGDKN